MPSHDMSGWTLLPPVGDFAELAGPIYSDGSNDEVFRQLCTWVEARHCNILGICHGAMIALLADQAMGMAIIAQSRTAVVAPTISLTVDYLQGAELGTRLLCTPEVLRIGKTVAYCEARITSQAGLVAIATGKFRILPATQG